MAMAADKRAEKEDEMKEALFLVNKTRGITRMIIIPLFVCAFLASGATAMAADGYDASKGHNAPGGWSAAQTTTLYSDSDSSTIQFDGSKNRTRYRWVGNADKSKANLAYCLNPALWGPTNTKDDEVTSQKVLMRRLAQSDFNKAWQYKAFCAALYYAPNGPGYEGYSAKWMPSADYTGASLSAKEKMAATHVVLAYYFNDCNKALTFDASSSASQSNHNPTSAYWNWIGDHFIDMNAKGSANANGKWVQKALAHYNDADMLAHGNWTVASWQQHVWLINCGLKTDGSKRDNYNNYQFMAFAENSKAPTAQITLEKTSADSSLSAGNALYHLDGAKYDIYADAALKTKLGTIESDWKGSGTLSLSKLTTLTVYAQEASASQGYLRDAKTYTIQLKAGSAPSFGSASRYTGTFSSQEPPAYDEVYARKIDAADKKGLAGASFTLNYYAGTYASLSSLPDKADKSFTLTSGSDGKTPSVKLPLGSFTIQESAAPAGYQLDSTCYLGQIAMDGAAAHGAQAKAIAPESFKSMELEQGTLITLENTPILIGIEIEKQLSDGGDASGAEFSIINSSGKTVTIDGRSVADGAEALSVKSEQKDGKYIASTGKILPYGKYTVKEEKAPKGYGVNRAWAATVTCDASTHDGDKFSVGPCINDPLSGELVLQVQKSLYDADGARIEKDCPAFAFELIDESGKRLATSSCDKNGKAAFPLISLTHADAGQTTHYKIRELKAQNEEGDSTESDIDMRDISFDESEIDVQVQVRANDEKLTADVSYSSGGAAAIFENTRNIPYEIKIEKAFKNGELKEGAFTFLLKDENGNELARAHNKTDGSVSFGRMHLRDVHAGDSMRYTIEEERSWQPFVEFDEGYAEATLAIEERDGLLQAKISYRKFDGSGEEEKGSLHGGVPVFTNQLVKIALPLTGGDTPPAHLFMIGGGIAALACGAALLAIRRASRSSSRPRNPNWSARS